MDENRRSYLENTDLKNKMFLAALVLLYVSFVIKQKVPAVVIMVVYAVHYITVAIALIDARKTILNDSGNSKWSGFVFWVDKGCLFALSAAGFWIAYSLGFNGIPSD